MDENQGKDFMIIATNQLQVRHAGLSDIPAITEIYNEEVLHGTATFDTEPKSIEERISWLNNHGASHPVLVGCIDNAVVGWASLTRWSDRCAYDGTAEVSVYIHKDFRGRGIGTAMFGSLITEAANCRLHYLLSRISEGNEPSIRLHERYGFSLVGVMHEVGYKFGSYLDVTIMEKILRY